MSHSTGSSDALRSLTDGQEAKPADEVLVGELDEPTTLPSGRRRTPSTPKVDPQAMSAPILFTVGALLLFPAVWGTLVLAGLAVWRNDQAGAGTMAMVMQLCYPIGLALIAAAVLCFRQSRARR